MTDRTDELDPFVGWMSVADIRAVFLPALREMEYGVFPEGEHWRSAKLRGIKVLETAQQECYKRCRRNFQDFLDQRGKNPAKVPSPLSDNEKEASEKRMQKLEKWRG